MHWSLPHGADGQSDGAGTEPVRSVRDLRVRGSFDLALPAFSVDLIGEFPDVLLKVPSPEPGRLVR